MKQYLCIKDYATLSGDIAYKKGKIYDLDKDNKLVSELPYIALKKGTMFFKECFKKHKPVKSFGGNGLYELPQPNSRANGMWTGEVITGLGKVQTNDPIVYSVITKFQQRSAIGIEKYGTTLADNNTDDFLTHAIEESMDFILYLHKIKAILKKKGLTKLEEI